MPAGYNLAEISSNWPKAPKIAFHLQHARVRGARGARRRERRGRREEPSLGINLPNAVFMPFLAPEATVLYVFFPTGRDAGARWVVEDSLTYPSSRSSPFSFSPFLFPFLSYLFYDGHIGIGACIQDFAFSCDFFFNRLHTIAQLCQIARHARVFSKTGPGGHNPVANRVAGFSLCDIITHSLTQSIIPPSPPPPLHTRTGKRRQQDGWGGGDQNQLTGKR